MVISGKKSMPFQDVMRIRFGETEGEIMGRGFFKSPRNKNVPLGFSVPFWEVGMAGAEVEVDEMTGAVRIVRYVSLTDSGKMINPILCRGQDEGATLFGMGLSLSEELHYRDGKLINHNLVDYRVPRFRDLPEQFLTHILEEGGGPGPHGAKGMGEGGILGVAPAVCNALYNATGVRMHRVPLLGERVLEAIERHKKGQSGKK
jgi:CO/xanthine dehydrogenase Mo-binding subunit